MLGRLESEAAGWLSLSGLFRFFNGGDSGDPGVSGTKQGSESGSSISYDSMTDTYTATLTRPVAIPSAAVAQVRSRELPIAADQVITETFHWDGKLRERISSTTSEGNGYRPTRSFYQFVRSRGKDLADSSGGPTTEEANFFRDMVWSQSEHLAKEGFFAPEPNEAHKGIHIEGRTSVPPAHGEFVVGRIDLIGSGSIGSHDSTTDSDNHSNSTKGKSNKFQIVSDLRRYSAMKLPNGSSTAEAPGKSHDASEGTSKNWPSTFLRYWQPLATVVDWISPENRRFRGILDISIEGPDEKNASQDESLYMSIMQPHLVQNFIQSLILSKDGEERLSNMDRELLLSSPALSDYGKKSKSFSSKSKSKAVSENAFLGVKRASGLPNLPNDFSDTGSDSENNADNIDRRLAAGETVIVTGNPGNTNSNRNNKLNNNSINIHPKVSVLDPLLVDVSASVLHGLGKLAFARRDKNFSDLVEGLQQIDDTLSKGMGRVALLVSEDARTMIWVSKAYARNKAEENTVKAIEHSENLHQESAGDTPESNLWTTIREELEKGKEPLMED